MGGAERAELFAFAVARPAQVRERVAKDARFASKVHEIARRIGKLDPDTPRLLAIDY